MMKSEWVDANGMPTTTTMVVAAGSNVTGIDGDGNGIKMSLCCAFYLKIRLQLNDGWDAHKKPLQQGFDKFKQF